MPHASSPPAANAAAALSAGGVGVDHGKQTCFQVKFSCPAFIKTKDGSIELILGHSLENKYARLSLAILSQ
jgi:hypothetical protein